MIRNITLLALVLVLFSCKKQNEPAVTEPAQEALHEVNFTMSGFRATTGVLSTPAVKATNAVGDTLKKYADNLYYRIYNAKGEWIRSIDQTSTNGDFGTITDRLPAGTYQVFLAACKGQLFVSGKDYNYTNGYITLASTRVWNDTFTKTFTLTVGNTDVSQTVRLERLVAGCQIVLPDGLPATVTKLKIVVIGDYNYASFAAAMLYNTGLSEYNYEFSGTTSTGTNTFSFLVSNNVTPVNIYITAYNSTGILMVDKRLFDLKFERNKMTTITGNLFPRGSVPTDFTVGVNPNWDTGNTERY